MTMFYALRPKGSLDLLFKRPTESSTMSAAREGYQSKRGMRGRGNPEYSFRDYLTAYELVSVNLEVRAYPSS